MSRSRINAYVVAAYHPDMEDSDFQRVSVSILQDIWYLLHLIKANFYLSKVKQKFSINMLIIYFTETDQPGASKKSYTLMLVLILT